MKPSTALLPTILFAAALCAPSCASSEDQPANTVNGTGGQAGKDGGTGGGGGSVDAGDSGGSAGTAGSAGKAGNAGTSGAAGKAGGDGFGGAAGTSGTGGSAGSAGEDGGTAGSQPDGGPGGCRKISAQDFTDFNSPAGVIGVVTPNIGGADHDALNVELYEDGEIQKPGTYDLGLETDYQGCNHCVFVVQDTQDGVKGIKYFFQASGQIELFDVTSPPTGQFRGKLSNVKLIEVESVGTVPVPDGECLFIESLSWDTIVYPADAGTPCRQAVECGPTSQYVCDPKIAGCGVYQCGYPTGGKACTANQVCLGQVKDAIVGACYVRCTPFGAPSCPDNFECLPPHNDLYDQSNGACYGVGSGAANGPCDASESVVGSGCVQSYQCHDEDSQKICRERCDFLGADPKCTAADQRCTPLGLCTPEEGDAAKIGEKCEKWGKYCGLAGQSYRGRCSLGIGPDAGFDETCLQICRLDVPTDCPDGQKCTKHGWSDSVGACE